MPALISIFANKGGTGKTTLSIHLASSFAKTGHKVGIVDADPQKSLTNIARVFPTLELPVVDVVEPSELSKLNHKLIIADLAPQITNYTLKLLQASNLILMPCKASVIDAISLINTYEYIRGNTDTKAVAVVNMATRSNVVHRTIDLLKNENISVLNGIVYNRVVYSESIEYGKSLFKAGNSQAIAEINELSKSVLAELI